MNGQQFFFCSVCGSNLAGMMKHTGVPMCCCNHEMELLQAGCGNSSDAHVVNVKVDGNRVHVVVNDAGGNLHPMGKDHHIEWIYLHTQEQGQRKMLRPGMPPEAVFLLERMEAAILYVYCTNHGLWEKALASPSTGGIDA